MSMIANVETNPNFLILERLIMVIKSFVNKGLIVATMVVLSACGGPKMMSDPMPKSGFLPDYSLLKPVTGIPKAEDTRFILNQALPNVSKSSEDIRYWRYVRGGIKPATYNAVIIDPVYINYQRTSTLSTDAIASTKAQLQAEMRRAIKDHGGIKIVDKPGPGVFRIAVGITGAERHDDTLQPWFFSPVGVAVNAAAYATDLNAKTPAMIFEAKTTDSQSNLLLGEGLIIVQGESYRTNTGSVEEFTNLAIKAINSVMALSADSSPIGK